MDSDNLFGLLLGIITVICVLGISIPIMVCNVNAKNKEFELEKYRIEMQVKHGDIGENIEGEN